MTTVSRGPLCPTMPPTHHWPKTPPALLDSLDLILTHGTLAPETRQRITDVLASIDQQSTDTSELKTQAAVILIMTSPEYIVLR